jgi:hypothetical protein
MIYHYCLKALSGHGNGCADIDYYWYNLNAGAMS